MLVLLILIKKVSKLKFFFDNYQPLSISNTQPNTKSLIKIKIFFNPLPNGIGKKTDIRY